MNFTDFNLVRNLQEAIEDIGYQKPTPIQAQAIPIILAEKDIVGTAQTGTGKTAAFAIPVINYLHRMVSSSKRKKKIRALVLTPTRELAIQVAENFENYAKYTKIKTLVIFGGVSQVPQVNALKEGTDVLVVTPGRLLDLHKQGHVHLDDLHQLILDEADLMLDMGFINDVKKVIKLTPDNRQTLLFSATMPMAIRELADTFLKNPKYVSVAPVSSASDIVKQQVFFVEKEHKRKLLLHLIQTQNLKNVLIFTRTKGGANNVAKFLQKNNITAEAIHGDKSQNTRQRVLNNFKDKEVDVLVATDVASRGIDIDLLPYVINYDLPNVPETYVHRIGRTGRAGNEGLAISFCGKDEKSYLQGIEKLIRKKIKVITDHPYPWTDAPAQQQPKQTTPKKNSRGNSNKKNNQSRKSNQSKKNKKRWY